MSIHQNEHPEIRTFPRIWELTENEYKHGLHVDNWFLGNRTGFSVYVEGQRASGGIHLFENSPELSHEPWHLQRILVSGKMPIWCRQKPRFCSCPPSRGESTITVQLVSSDRWGTILHLLVPFSGRQTISSVGTDITPLPTSGLTTSDGTPCERQPARIVVSHAEHVQAPNITSRARI